MSKTMLIDAAHPEETRVVLLAGNQIDDFDFESQAKKQIRGNIYLAKVTRVEPSLQAGFVEYGGNRHGFLAFGEIHPDYYQIPAADREALLAEEAALALADEEADGDEETLRARRAAQRRYKIQEVIRRRQIMLVQAVKEERGNKGAALTTYLSLAGRYCVLMPNTPRGGGISRKIANASDRKRLKAVIGELEVPKGMGLIIRTAGAKRTKTEIKRDYEYLLRLWDDIRERTMASIAPALIHEEDNLVKRAVRDLYDKDVDAILVEGEAAFEEAQEFMGMLMPSHVGKVQLYDGSTPLFSRMKVEGHLDSIHSPIVQLRSGGYIVINQTEALVAIDVNSGRSTRERSIESTALKTNLEAADEAARQMRLRDLAGLVVIDFIDMEENRNDRAVEKRMKDALRFDRARVQMGKISGFGLLEISRQRRRTGVLEGSSHVCEACDGVGRVRSPESASLQALRAVEAAVATRRNCEVALHAEIATALYLLNEKRDHLTRLLKERGLIVRVFAESDMNAGQYRFEIVEAGEEVAEHEFVPVYLKIEDPIDEDEIIEVDDEDDAQDESPVQAVEGEESEDTSREGGKKRRRRRRGRRSEEETSERASEKTRALGGHEDGDVSAAEDDNDGEEEERGDGAIDEDNTADAQARRRRRRGRRGGRRRREGEGEVLRQDPSASETTEPSVVEADIEAAVDTVVGSTPVDASEHTELLETVETPAKPKRASRKKRTELEADTLASTTASTASVAADENTDQPKPVKAVRAKRTTKAKAAKSEVPMSEVPVPEVPVSGETVAVVSPDEPNARPIAEDTSPPVEVVVTPETVPETVSEPTAEVLTVAPVEPIAQQPNPKPEGPKRSGWWSRNSKKLFGG